MGEQSQFHRRFFASKQSKRLKGTVAQPPQQPNGLMSPVVENDGRHSVAANAAESADDVLDQLETRPKEVLHRPAEQRLQLSRQSATNRNFQETAFTGADDDHDEPPGESVNETGPGSRDHAREDSSLSSVQLAEGSLSTIRHIDDDDDDCEELEEPEDQEQASEVANDDKQIDQSAHVEPSELAQVEASEAGPAQATRSPTNSHIETLSFHHHHHHHQQPPDHNYEESRGQPVSRGRLRDSRLFKATKAILLFRRATSSLSRGNSSLSAAAGSDAHFSRTSSATRAFVAALWPRQNTADNSTCTRSSRLDSLASSSFQQQAPTAASNNHCSRSSSSFAFLNGGGGGGSGGGGTKNSSQVSLNQPQRSSSNNNNNNNKGGPDQHSSSSFSLPRFIVPRMNALRLPIVCLIKSLEGELMREVFIHRYELGQYIMDNLKVSLDMKDSKYFGLKVANSLDDQEDVRQPWLDLNESVYKQISKFSRVITIKNDHNENDQLQQQQQQQLNNNTTTKSVDFYLRIKYYPPNLARIQDPFLKQYLWLQLRRDLRLGKLTSSMQNLTYLMACVLQYELGDYKRELVDEKVARLNVLPNQDLIEQQALEIWQARLSGAKRHLVLMQFLRASVILETYGFDYYPVRDHQRQRAYLLGFNYAGIKTIRNGRIINHFRWHNLSKISHERRMIIFHIYPNENSKRKQILGFKCLSNEDCQNLYMRLLEQKYFFTVDLTYFDKSIRRPSHLTESALGAAEQQQLSDWSAATPVSSREGRAGGGLAGTTRRQRTLDTDFSFEDEDDADDDERLGYSEPNGAEVEEEVGVSQRADVTRDTGATVASPRAASTAATCECADCRRAGLVKARSLQEPYGQRRDAAPNIRQHSEHAADRHYQSTTTGGHAPPGSREVGVSHAYPHDPPTMDADECEPPTPRAAHFPQAPLQRQHSVSKYPAEFGRAPPGGATSAMRTPQQAQQILSTSNNTNGSSSSSRTAGQRLVEWTEQILVQPAALVANTSGQWLPGSAREPVVVPRRTHSSDVVVQEPVPLSVSGDLFVQAMRFCLLILAMNFLLRLSDGLSGLLIELLTFGTTHTQPASRDPSSSSSGGGTS